MTLLRTARAFVTRDFYITTSYKFQFLFSLWTGLFAIIIFFFVSRLVDPRLTDGALAPYRTDLFSFIAIGVAASGFLQSGLTGFAERLRTGMSEGSLEMMFASPTHPVWILTLPSLWTFTFEAIRAAVMIAFAVVVLKADLACSSLIASAVILLLTLTTYSVFGMIACATVMIFKRGDPINWAFAHVSAFVAGAYVPVELLPGWLQRVAHFLPMTHAYRGLRMTLLSGAGLGEIRFEVLLLGIFSLVGLPVAAYLTHAAVARARREGSLGMF